VKVSVVDCGASSIILNRGEQNKKGERTPPVPGKNGRKRGGGPKIK